MFRLGIRQTAIQHGRWTVFLRSKGGIPRLFENKRVDSKACKCAANCSIRSQETDFGRGVSSTHGTPLAGSNAILPEDEAWLLGLGWGL
jgi:hypothetical protein